MIKVGIGWLGLSEEEVMTMNMNNIVLGHQGKVEMLEAVFGSKDSKTKKHKPTANDLKAFARAHRTAGKRQ